MNRLFLHVPNLLTAFRLVAAPLLALLILSSRFEEAFVVFIFAGASDAADGYLAKRFALTTEFGRFLDPAADKLLMLGSFLTLTMVGVTPVWLAILVIGRDLGIVLGSFLAWALDLPLRIAPLPLGKASTAFQVSYIALVLLLTVLSDDWPRIAGIAAALTGAVTLVSGLNYAALWLRALIARVGRTA